MAKYTSPQHPSPEGSIVELDGETYYRIARSDRMPTFLMSIPSDTDLWMFVASNGGLAAGRADADGSLFPYETVDRLYDSAHHSGPITLVRVQREGANVLWQPFCAPGAKSAQVERHLYKSQVGNAVIFEEVNLELGLAFRYRWSAAEAFGWVRSARLTNLSGSEVSLQVLDGLRDVLPFGASLALYQQQSCLIDAYKRSECDPATGLAIYSLSARITDRAEAAEELRANIVWSQGMPHATISLADESIAAFRLGEPIDGDKLRTGRRGNYLVSAALTLAPGAHQAWYTVADARREPVAIVALRERLRGGDGLANAIETALAEATRSLIANVASADGLQCTAHAEGTMHHFANVLFNNMRGGVFAAGHEVPVDDLADFLRTRNRNVARRHGDWLDSLGATIEPRGLVDRAATMCDADLDRLVHEYLPLHFGRRHGDPSRPWNRFSIRARRPDGRPTLYYEGNWRDVFQNWEALAQSFPHFLPNMVARFVNASTLDGFNPYRITRDGVDWEVIEPDSPWSYIGYWGDHQVVYLLRLLESLRRTSPEVLMRMLERPIFSYANVPYRIKPYDDLRRDPHSTVDFDATLQTRIEKRVEELGTDGRLVAASNGGVHHANLIEKLLVTALARLSNFVPDGGIWMNTQRPEWNDANNALAGYGVSTVTLCYLRRYLAFLSDTLTARGGESVVLSVEITAWMQRVTTTLETHRPAKRGERRDDRERRVIVDALGGAFSDYRARVYESGPAHSAATPVEQLHALCRIALEHIDHTLESNPRADGLAHAYHVLGPMDREGLEVRPLYEMLEGQVAALSTGAMRPAEAVQLVDRLFESRMYDPQRLSFMLYPERVLPGFFEKNSLPAERVGEIDLLGSLLAASDDRLVALDAAGTYRFHPDLGSVRDLIARLGTLAAEPQWTAMVARDREAVLELYEHVFHHRSFTGRSGTMYGYEGLGCIYWHMVTKLLLAVQEQAIAALDAHDPVAPRLIAQYYRIRAGLGFERSPGDYGAFPTDPYSHTPRHAGAQQPGMTGQVKEEILARFGELGASVRSGRASFRPRMLRRAEFLSAARTWRYIGITGASAPFEVPSEALAFTWCGTPIVYHLVDGEGWLRVHRTGGARDTVAGDTLSLDDTRALLARSGAIERIDVGIPRSTILEDGPR